MKIPTCNLAKVGVLAVSGMGSTLQMPAQVAQGSDGITAVSSKTSPDYVRAKLSDGSFQAEGYAFGPGGHFGGQMSDLSIDRLQFMDVARVIAGPLASRKYLPEKDPEKTKLLIMVYWGLTTVPPPPEESAAYIGLRQAQTNLQIAIQTDPFPVVLMCEDAVKAALVQVAMENNQRDREDFRNAKMLGYDRDGLIGTDFGNFVQHSPLAAGQLRNDLVAEIEDNRYFVVLMAYDFRLLWKKKQHKLLWETRFSIRRRHNDFDVALPVMARYASKYFGEDSQGLVRNQVPGGHVEVGDPTVVEFLFGSKK